VSNMATYYCILLSSLAGLFSKRGAAPPPSRKFLETPLEPPWLVEARPPLKYGARSTAVPLNSPGARIPATEIPTFGFVSVFEGIRKWVLNIWGVFQKVI